MAKQESLPDEGRQVVDITDLAVLGEQFPLRLMQLGFRLMQALDAAGRDTSRYVVPPTCEVREGAFLMGSPTATSDFQPGAQIPQFESFLPTFHMGVFPVTVAEYIYAILARVVREPKTDGQVSWQHQQRFPDHPIVCLTFHQATAYVD